MSILFAMCLFALTMSISPGPVNLMTLSSGVNHGFRLTLPFVTGASAGFTLLLLGIGLGLGKLTDLMPNFLNGLGLIGSAFIGYMGLAIARDASEIRARSECVPTFRQGVLLQWLNPKAWIACLAGTTAFQLADSVTLLMAFVTLYGVICYASIASWAWLGHSVQATLLRHSLVVGFNRFMGVGLIVVAVYLFCFQISIFN